MTAAASFKEYYSRSTTGAGGNRNEDGFNTAMDPETDRRVALKAFNNIDGSFFYAGPNKQLKIVHGLTDMGNTITRPESKIGGHMGLSDIAFIGIVNFDEALSITTFETPKGEELANCITSDALRGLQPGDSPDTYERPKVFIPAPFIQQAVIQSGSSCPIELIFKVREAYTKLYENLDPSLEDATNAHVELFEQFCWGVHNEKFTMGTILSPDADDDELMSFSKGYHASRINSEGTTTSMLGVAPTGGREVSLGNIEVLTSTLTRIVEEQGSSAEILERMHQFAVDKEDEKKEKSVKWHPSTTKFVRYAASIDGIAPATTIPLTFRRVINADSLGQADIELTEQMRAAGHEEIEWDLIFTNSLRHGMFCYVKLDTPSNFTIFGIRVKNPTALNEQQARGMNLHILEAGKDNNKSIMEMIQSNKKPIKIPTDIEELTTIVKGFGGLATILFGKNSSLPTSLIQLARDLSLNKFILKCKIMNDPTLIAKILYTVDSRTQLWASYLRRAEDREYVSDQTIDFSSVLNDVLLEQFHVNLPAIFTSPKKSRDEDEYEVDEQGRRKKKKKGSPLKEIEGDRKEKNKNIPVEFRLRPGEDYRKVFAHRCLEDRPKWNDSCKMCPRWWIFGVCYSDCNNAESHVDSDQLPQDKKSAFIEFLEKARRG